MIYVRELIKTFGEVTAVNGISFQVEVGEIFAFLGPNGAGKTTTVKMLTTLLTPTSGEIRIDGLDPMRQRHEVRRRIGVVFQEPSLDANLSAWDNMDLHGALYKMPRKQRRERAELLLSLFGLSDRKDEEVQELSGGMRRRLEVARGLLHMPKLLFLDEPTLGLDPQMRYQLWTYVRELNQRESITVFLTTHYLEEADRVASRIAIIDSGEIVALGNPSELKERTRKTSLEEAFLSLTAAHARGLISEFRERIPNIRRI